MEIDHLVLALLYEDQGDIEKALYGLPDLKRMAAGFGGTAHKPFFPPDMASNLIRKIEQGLPQGEPLPPSSDMPMSSDLKQALGIAGDLLERHGWNQIEPLHLLAAILQEGSSQCAVMLRQAGVTESTVIEAISSEGPGSD